MEPGQSATVVVALALIGATPVMTRAGKTRKLPPPATEFMAPPANAAANSKAAWTASGSVIGSEGCPFLASGARASRHHPCQLYHIAQQLCDAGTLIPAHRDSCADTAGVHEISRAAGGTMMSPHYSIHIDLTPSRRAAGGTMMFPHPTGRYAERLLRPSPADVQPCCRLCLPCQPLGEDLRRLVGDLCAGRRRYLAHRRRHLLGGRRQLRPALAAAAGVLRDRAQAFRTVLGRRRLRALAVHRSICLRQPHGYILCGCHTRQEERRWPRSFHDST